MTDQTQLLAVVAQANPVPDPVATAEHLDAYQSLLAVIDERSETMQSPTIEREVMKPEPPLRRRAVWAFTAAFVVVLVIVGLVALLADNDGVPVVEEPTTTTVVTTTTTEAPTTTTQVATTAAVEAFTTTTVGVLDVRQAPTTWRRVDVADSADSSVESIAMGGPGLIAVGTIQAPTQDGGYAVDAAVWVSTDGEAWERVESDAFGAGTEDPDGQLGTQWMSDVATSGDRVVAVGYEGYAAAVWTSDDGSSWDRVVDDDLPPGTTDSYMNAVVAHGAGFLAVGSHGGDAGIWISSDGLDWTQIVADDLLRDSSGEVGLWDVARYESGFVAVGAKGWENPGGSASFDMVIAVSEDGVEWDRIPVVESATEGRGLTLPEELEGRSMWGSSVRAINGRLLVTSWVGAGDGALFISTDARSWDVLPVPDGAGRAGLASWSNYVVTMGRYGGPQPAVWLASGDMAEWQVAPIGEMADLRVAVPLGSRILVGGASYGADGSEFRAGIWIGSMED